MVVGSPEGWPAERLPHRTCPFSKRSCDGHALGLAPLRAEVEVLVPLHR